MDQIIQRIAVELFQDEIVINPFLEVIPLVEINVDVLHLLNLDVEHEEAVHNANYFEEVIPRYLPEDFFKHFRMSRRVMEMLIMDIGNRLHIRGIIDIQKKTLFTLWMLAKPESFLACSDRFGLSKGTGHLIFYQICNALCEMMLREIKWPSNEQLLQTAQTFQERTGFPGVVGAIYGCYIAIKAPAHNAVDYYNRKQFHSVILQGLCNEKQLFTDIFVGMPGRVHDARAFRVSPLYQKITNENAPLFPDNLHVLGDGAHPLMRNVLVPFRDGGHLTPMQINYNTTLSTARSKIEQAFARLKGKFRRLKFLDANIENVSTVISAACVLHNYTIRRQGLQNFDLDAVENEYNENEGDPKEFVDGNINFAIQKRRQIMEHLY